MDDAAIASDRLAARAVAVGIGLITLMVVWLVANRVTALVLSPPVGPIVAISLAVVAGAVAAVVGVRRLSPPAA